MLFEEATVLIRKARAGREREEKKGEKKKEGLQRLATGGTELVGKGESERRREVRLGEEGSPDGAQVHPALKGFDHSVTSSLFFCFQAEISNSNGGYLDTLARLPPLGFPGSLTIFLLSLISSW